MNLMNGGTGGGFVHEEHRKKFYASGGKKVYQMLGKRHIEKLKMDAEYKKRYSKIMSECQRGEKNGFYGKKHSEETKIKMKKSHKDKHFGINNSQYGKCWITNEKESKMIYKDDSIPEGWRLGRTLKKQNL